MDIDWNAELVDQLVRAGQHADRVQLDRADPPEHGGHAASPGLRADEALSPEGHEPGVIQ